MEIANLTSDQSAAANDVISDQGKASESSNHTRRGSGFDKCCWGAPARAVPLYLVQQCRHRCKQRSATDLCCIVLFVYWICFDLRHMYAHVGTYWVLRYVNVWMLFRQLS